MAEEAGTAAGSNSLFLDIPFVDTAITPLHAPHRHRRRHGNSPRGLVHSCTNHAVFLSRDNGTIFVEIFSFFPNYQVS